ncbi:MAG TPA: TIGR03087 family PEP-CTERM/XrtA system glycosyltransferase [Gammaproteobacteria bacterium]|nr:TIGR03087 family PEP-CTERM/XrtA system glycosyltransferase [Gammaproteobacteria bacterium]
MSDIIFLSHRIPFPPNKGDKIRSWHMLKHLAATHRMHLGTFIDDPHDRAYLDELQELCADVCAIDINPRLARLRSLTGLVTGEPLTVSYYRSRRLMAWVRHVLATQSVAGVVAYSSGVAPFVPAGTGAVRIMDFVDVDSAKWRQYANVASGPARFIYAREARKLAQFERDVAQRFDAALFASPAEADFFRSALGRSAPHVHGMSNGVDTDTFNPDSMGESPYPSGKPVIVFTGMMNYRANVEGVSWFTDQVFPRIRERMPEMLFYIVGARPTRAVRALDSRLGVHVTGRVIDIKPFIRYAHVAVAPLRIARGIQNKVLEALAMGTPVVGTPEAFEGIKAFPDSARMTAANPDDYAAAVVAAVGQRDPASPDVRLRDFVREHYSWDTNLALLDRLLAARKTTIDTSPQPGLPAMGQRA